MDAETSSYFIQCIIATVTQPTSLIESERKVNIRDYHLLSIIKKNSCIYEEVFVSEREGFDLSVSRKIKKKSALSFMSGFSEFEKKWSNNILKWRESEKAGKN